MKKILLFLIFSLILIPGIIALDNQPTVKQGECINISQTCSSCSYVNISSISNRENSSLILNEPMSSIGNGEWRYEFCNTNFLGRHDVRGQGDINGVDESFATYFEVTPSGEKSTENTIFFIAALALLYFLTLFFFSKRDIDLAPFVALSGMALGFLGVYMINNGIIIFRNTLTNYISYITIGIGFGLAIWSLVEWIQNNL